MVKADDTEEPSVPWKNCLSLGCDNAAVMIGKNGVYGWMSEKQPNLHLSGCPCHLLHRAAQMAASQLPFNIDEVLVDLYYYFDKSSKRLASLELLQEEVKNQKILKHVQTRWLSVGKCIDRLLENWEALVQFSKQNQLLQVHLQRSLELKDRKHFSGHQQTSSTACS